MPATVIVIEEVVAPVFQSRVPVEAVLKVVLPQLLLTFTTGVAGVALGVATAVPEALVHPFTVVVTL